MIQFLRGNKSQLEASQTIFGDGQPIFEKDTGQLKVGNGVDVFSSLPYVGEGLSSGLSGGSNYIDLSDNRRLHWGRDAGPGSDLEDMSPLVDGHWHMNNQMYVVSLPNSLSTIESYIAISELGDFNIVSVAIVSSVNIYITYMWNTEFFHGAWNTAFRYIAISSN